MICPRCKSQQLELVDDILVSLNVEKCLICAYPLRNRFIDDLNERAYESLEAYELSQDNKHLERAAKLIDLMLDEVKNE